MLLTSDLHLTGKKVDEYRWGIFDLLLKQRRITDSRDIFILGDLTDDKDRHDAQLVNKVVDKISELAKTCRVHVLAGNHDYIDSPTPFFRFLRHVHIPNVRYYTKPTWWRKIILIPHQKDFSSCLSEVEELMPGAKLVLMHQTVEGTRINNIALKGVNKKVFRRLGVPVYSGDVHIPGDEGPVTYVGAPYQVRFGDSYKPRILYFRRGVDTEAPKSIPTKFLHRWSVTVDWVKELKSIPFDPGDQVKIKFRVTHKNFPEWREIKKAIEHVVRERKVELVSMSVDARGLVTPPGKQKGTTILEISPEDLLARYCKEKSIGDILTDLGIGIVSGKTTSS